MVAIYLASRLVDGLFIWLLAGSQVSGRPPGYHVAVPTTGQAGYRDIVTNWDAQWYWDIVLHGYPHTAVDAAGEPVQSSLAFFPLFPKIAKLLGDATGLPFDIVGPTLSLCLGAAAFLVVFHLLADVAGTARAVLGLCVLTCFVSAPILQTAYTESLALLLLGLALLLLHRRQYLWAILPVAVLGLTRNIALALVPVIVLHGLVRLRQARQSTGATPVPVGRLALLLTATLLSTLEWPAMAGLITGERNAYFVTMKAWPGYTSSVLRPPWVDLVLSAPVVWQLLAATLVVLVLALLFRPNLRSWGPELWGWAASYPAYIFATTGVTLSFLRYLLLAFPFVLVVAGPATTQRQQRVRIAAVALACLVGLAAQWWWIGNALVIKPRNGGYAYP